MNNNNWKKFDYKKPLHGIYWVCGTYPDYDVDIDDYGKTIGSPTGKNIKYVALVNIEFNPSEDYFHVEPISEFETGGYDDEYGISYYMEFEIPKHPDEKIK